jgi:purine-binding chemotaxis protein CheW
VEKPHRQNVLLVRAGARLCALPIGSVAETMRPLPVSQVAGAPPFVLGVAIVRGEPVAVVELGAFVGGPQAPSAATRWVTVRAGGRHAALAVTAVLGVTELDAAGAGAVPLVGDACAGAIASLRSRDRDLLVVLDAARVVREAQVDGAPAAAEAGP